MDERTEKKLSDLSGMDIAIGELLQQAWERGRKYGNEEKKNIIRALQPAIEKICNTINNPDFINSINDYKRRGSWIFNQYSTWSCSVCGEIAKTPGYCGTAEFMEKYFKFCPHCGAIMIDDNEEGEGK